MSDPIIATGDRTITLAVELDRDVVRRISANLRGPDGKEATASQIAGVLALIAQQHDDPAYRIAMMQAQLTAALDRYVTIEEAIYKIASFVADAAAPKDGLCKFDGCKSTKQGAAQP